MQTTTENPPDARRLEALSALIDGECTHAEVAAVTADYAVSAQARAHWDSYHCIGDALRKQPAAGADSAFVAAVMQRVASEPLPNDLQPKAVTLPVVAEAANDAVFRWKMVAGVASVLAVAAVAWQVAVAPVPSAAPQLASAPAGVLVNAPGNGAVQAVVTEQGVVLRDPQLEELMAAHRQYGGMSALQMPAGFLRNATYDTSQR